MGGLVFGGSRAAPRLVYAVWVSVLFRVYAWLRRALSFGFEYGCTVHVWFSEMKSGLLFGRSGVCGAVWLHQEVRFC
jgi:hypothetical protein